MGKKQLIHLLQFVLIWVLVWGFITFVMDASFVNFILRYWLYFFVLSISYFYYYSIEYEPNKKYEFIRNVIIYGNVYLFLHLFFRPQLNISHQLFILLGLIVLGLWWTKKLKTRWKYLLQFVGGIFSFFILISGLFYFYPEQPDIEGFIESKTNELKFFGVVDTLKKDEAYIKITTLRGGEDFDITPSFNRILLENTKISYPSLNKQRDEKLVIVTPYGDLIWILPQSEVSIEFSGKALETVLKLNGRVGFLSGIFNSNISVLGKDQNLTKLEQDWLKGIQDIYKYDLVSYLKGQISESKMEFANSTIMYNIDGKIIKILSKMFPVTFSKNLQNYNEFQKYFSRFNDQVNLGRFSMKQSTGESIFSFRERLQDNVDEGKNATYGWFKVPKEG